MSKYIYQTLASFGYHHPLHPILAHLPIGLTMAGFLFSLIAVLRGKTVLAQTARHCMVLGLVSLLPTVILGYMDWQHFYNGAYLVPIKMKLMLAFVLIVLLCITVYWDLKIPENQRIIIAYGLCLITIAGLGYFGGELVFGRPSAPDMETIEKKGDQLVTKGEMAFNEHCAACHYTDRRDFKMGPGLKDLFLQETLYKSKWPATEANVRKQLIDPFDTMPPYNDLPSETLDALMAYLKII
jgi:uncharacterized membrane protein